MFITTKRAFKLAWKNFKRSGGLSLVAIFVLVATTFLATSLLLAREVSQEVVDEVESSADISVYFHTATSEDEIDSIKKEIEGEFEDVTINYTSRLEALESFREEHGENPVLMEALDEVGNQFSPTLDIKAEGVTDFREVSDFVRSSYGEVVDEIDFYRRKEAIESIFAITSRIETSLFVGSAILGLIAVFIVFGTIRLSIYSLSEEIKIMKLVGASDFYMQGSFIIQGFILGLLASIVSLIILLSGAALISQGYNPFGLDLETHILNNLQLILALQFSTGILLSVLSSWVAVRKYLKR